MIVARMEQREMQDRRHRVVLCCANRIVLRADRVVVSRRPAVGARHHAHAVGTQRVQFARRAVDAHRLHIGVARHHQVSVKALEKTLAALSRVGARQQSSSGCRAGEFRIALLENERQRCGGLGDEPHGTMHDGVLLKPSRDRAA